MDRFKISRVFKVNSLSWKRLAATWNDASKLLATGDQLHLRNIESFRRFHLRKLILFYFPLIFA